MCGILTQEWNGFGEVHTKKRKQANGIGNRREEAEKNGTSHNEASNIDILYIVFIVIHF